MTEGVIILDICTREFLPLDVIPDIGYRESLLVCTDGYSLPARGDNDKCVFGLNHKEKKGERFLLFIDTKGSRVNDIRQISHKFSSFVPLH